MMRPYAGLHVAFVCERKVIHACHLTEAFDHGVQSGCSLLNLFEVLPEVFLSIFL